MVITKDRTQTMLGRKTEQRALPDDREVFTAASGPGRRWYTGAQRPRAMVIEPSVAMNGWIFV
jgi:hypothetical protein